MHNNPQNSHIILTCTSLEHIDVINDIGFARDNLLIGGDKNGSRLGSFRPTPTGFLSANSLVTILKSS